MLSIILLTVGLFGCQQSSGTEYNSDHITKQGDENGSYDCGYL